MIIVGVYVDDILVTATKAPLVDSFLQGWNHFPLKTWEMCLNY